MLPRRTRVDVGSNDNEGVLSIPQSPNITGTSPSDCLASYPGLSLVGLIPLKRCSWCILQPQLTGQNIVIETKQINHIISKCRKISQKDYKTRHGWVIYKEFCKTLKFDQNTKWLMHKPECVQTNETHNLLLHFFSNRSLNIGHNFSDN